MDSNLASLETNNLSVYHLGPIRFENGATATADNGFPGPPVERDTAEPRRCNHVHYAGSTTTSRA